MKKVFMFNVAVWFSLIVIAAFISRNSSAQSTTQHAVPTGFLSEPPMQQECVGIILRTNGTLVARWKGSWFYFWPEKVTTVKKAWQETYVASNGVIVLQKSEEVEMQQHDTIDVPEKIEWKDN
jgi:hypothetical protein